LNRVMRLAELMPGQAGRVVYLTGGYGFMRRLTDMGLTPGVLVRVLKNDVGPIVVEVRGIRLALGRGVASRILVEPIG